jgi:uncharacterized phage-like protein YoqJ
MRRVCVTGHRPPKIGGYGPDSPLRVWVRDSLRTVMDEIRPNYAYTGMALGVDQEFAQICIDMGVPFIAALPFKGQETKWPIEAQHLYWQLANAAREIIHISDPGYATWKLQRRNEWMVDEIGTDGIVVAVWDGSPSGTANCLAYARASQRRIIRIDPLTREVR